jgi:hypothetical protein
MSETENVVDDFLDKKLKFSEEIDEAQAAARIALRLACDSGTASEISQLANSIQAINNVWYLNQEQIRELVEIKEGKRYKATSTDVYRRALKYSEGKE